MTERQFTANIEQVPVNLVMGSDSDRGIVEQAADTLDQFEVEYIARIISAHRTYEELEDYATVIRLRKTGLVVLAFAGMSAALGGDLAARLPITVIGVPLEKQPDGQNSAIGSMINMPPGSGLTIVGPNQGKNAALAAVRVLAVADPEMRQKMMDFQKAERQETATKDLEMQ